MKTRMTVVYQCKKCGTEITVNSAGLKSVVPIYCCGLPLEKTKNAAVNSATSKKQMALSGKKSLKKETCKTSKKAAIKPSRNKEVSR